MDPNNLDLAGFAMVDDILSAHECGLIADRIHSGTVAGTRKLLELEWCAALAARMGGHPDLSRFLGPGYVAVQCTYFEKSAERNWLVPVHQDLSIPVAEQVDDAGLHGWSKKEGAVYVRAPVEFLERLVAVRVHLDDCTGNDGPLRVIPGTHRQGIITAEAAAEARKVMPSVLCTAQRGSALVMRPLVLHASSKASGSSKRRVLHFVFAPPQPPKGLRWP